MVELLESDVSGRIIGAAIEVHRELGPGLLESAYEACLAHLLIEAGLKVETQRPLSVSFRGIQLDCGYRIDMVVNDRVIVELKSVERIDPIHKAQLLSYLKLSKLRVGLLINFNVTQLKDGITRIVH